jgi:hypothetical protein
MAGESANELPQELGVSDAPIYAWKARAQAAEAG